MRDLSLAFGAVGTGSLSQLELILRLLVAAALGSLIGVERERLAWAAGLRTHMLVSVGSCLVMIVSAYGFGDVLHGSNITLDPSRVAAQVVSGIGFIGAGCILLRGDVVRGLTTAASLWTVAAIGLAVGGGLYVGAISATVIILVILTGLKPLEEWLQHRNKIHKLEVTAEPNSLSLAEIEQTLGYRARRIRRLASVSNENAEHISIEIERLHENDLRQIRDILMSLPAVKDVR